ncbi:putative Choline transport protein [Glarea lozoyensis 74030]|uniref:Putative Choline transport protein n=1 Tax=Glarea lozoyensis (strain ATCC 74030 / MF5533) TaxID=1104152 RepID=H0ENL2_GLAL7|nr:putative Choline transport protein [Glarea lozoyensis 74030]
MEDPETKAVGDGRDATLQQFGYEQGILAMGATNSFIGANFILGQAQLTHPSFTIERWHTVLVAYGTILACNQNKQPASFVFQDFQNFTGFSAPMAGIIGILQPAFGMCCYDAPAHMCEEIKDASKQAPRAIVMSVWIGCVTGFVFLVSVCFCIGDITLVAETPTLVPLIQIYHDSTNSNVGTCFLASFIVVINMGSANALLAEGARSLYAFARDEGLPFSHIIRKVEKKHQIPVVAIVLATVVQMAFNSIYFGTVTGFNTVIAIATEGFYLSYAMPLLVRLISYFHGSHKQLNGPWAMKPLVSIIVNAIGLTYLVFACITFNFPSVSPVTSENMNYTSAAVGAIMFIAAITWFTSASKKFSGPDIEDVIAIAGAVPSSDSDNVNTHEKKMDL